MQEPLGKEKQAHDVWSSSWYRPRQFLLIILEISRLGFRRCHQKIRLQIWNFIMNNVSFRNDIIMWRKILNVSSICFVIFSNQLQPTPCSIWALFTAVAHGTGLQRITNCSHSLSSSLRVAKMKGWWKSKGEGELEGVKTANSKNTQCWS